MKLPRYGRPTPVSPRLYQLMLDAWGLAIGFAAIVAAVLAIVLPEGLAQESSTSAQLGEVLQDLFTLSYGVAGSFIVYGLVTRNYPADAFGLVLLATVTLVRLVAFLSVAGWAGVYAAPTTVALVVAALARAAVASQLVAPKGGRP